MSNILISLFQDAPEQAVKETSVLFRAGDPVRNLFLVESGSIALERCLETGALTCLQRAQAGHILAEASVYATAYHCDARALEDCTVKAVPVKEFRQRLRTDPDLAEAWSRHLAHMVQATRFLSELRGMRTVSDRLDAWLAEHQAPPAKGQWKTLAAELAVSPEALYREMAKRGANT